jgi:hypothetical protein
MQYSAFLAFLLLGVTSVLAHDHGHGHELAAPGEKQKPIDAILWIHILLQTVLWGIIFPVGMVLGLSRSRWHVPLQVRILGLWMAWKVVTHISDVLLFLILERGHSLDFGWHLPWSRSRRPPVPRVCTWCTRPAYPHTHPCSAGARNISEASHP